jgi:hypothetical protein
LFAAENGRTSDVLELIGGGANIEFKDHVRQFSLAPHFAQVKMC